MTKPTSDQLTQLKQALLDAFNYAALTRLTHRHLNLHIEWITLVAGKRDLTAIAENLIAYFANQEGGLKQLLDAAIEENPSNAALNTLADQWTDLKFAPIPPPPEHPSIFAAERAVVAGGNITGSVIVTGDGSNVTINQEAQPYRLPLQRPPRAEHFQDRKEELGGFCKTPRKGIFQSLYL